MWLLLPLSLMTRTPADLSGTVYAEADPAGLVVQELTSVYAEADPAGLVVRSCYPQGMQELTRHATCCALLLTSGYAGADPALLVVHSC